MVTTVGLWARVGKKSPSMEAVARGTGAPAQPTSALGNAASLPASAVHALRSRPRLLSRGNHRIQGPQDPQSRQHLRGLIENTFPHPRPRRGGTVSPANVASRTRHAARSPSSTKAAQKISRLVGQTRMREVVQEAALHVTMLSWEKCCPRPASRG